MNSNILRNTNYIQAQSHCTCEIQSPVMSYLCTQPGRADYAVIFKFLPDLLQKDKTAHFFGHFETQKSQNSLSNHPALFSWLLRTKFQHPGFKNEDFLIYFEFMRSMVQKVQKNLLWPCFFNILRPKTPKIC